MAGSEREASVKLTLKSGSFLVSLKELAGENEKAAKRTENAWKKAGVAGLKALKAEIGDTFSSLKTAVKTAVTLGGAFSFGSAIRGAIESQSQFRNLAFAVKAGTGEIVKWNDLQRDAQITALQWGQRTHELGSAYQELFDEVGDIGFAEAGMENAALAARATGKDVGMLANIVGVLNEKFDVTADELPETMAAVVSLGNKGGISIEQMGEKIGILGASAKAAGLSGQAGFQTIVGMANIADNAMGSFKKSLAAVTGLLDSFGTPEQAKKIAGVFGVSMKDAKHNARGLTDVLGDVFAKTGGKRELLAKAFTGEQLKLVLELAKPFTEAFGQTGGTIKEKTAAGLGAYKAALEKAGKSQLTAADLAAEAQKRMEDPQARLNIALEKLQQSFAKPQMIAAIERLSSQLPVLADKMAGLIDFVLDNPKTAAGIFLGFKLGAPVLGAIFQSGAASFAKAAAGALGGGGALGGLGKAAGVASVGLAGFEAGGLFADKVIDPAERESKGISNSLSDAMLAADLNTSGKFSKGGGEASLANLRSRLDAAKKDKEFSFSDVYSFGLRRLGTSSDEDIEKGEKLYAERRAALDKLPDASGKATDAMNDIAAAARAAAAALGSIGGGGAPPGGGASRGPPRPAPVGPGYK